MSPGESTAERRPRCPTCGAEVQWQGNPARPFCSTTCKLIDLGQWLDEVHRVPGPPIGREPEEDPTASPDPGPHG
ncbi:MAG TPA: DNA gyrase inhibitor YacG [Methylomirabilota bacterium]|jgi:hypothetical protein|nr:DNA gyrase inhibitor YacG [Methylomirabilota bacterium]